MKNVLDIKIDLLSIPQRSKAFDFQGLKREAE